MRDAVEPGRKGQPHVFVSTDAFQRLEKNLRSEVFRVIGIADPKIDVVIDPLNVTLIKGAECFRICSCKVDQGYFIGFVSQLDLPESDYIPCLTSCFNRQRSRFGVQ